MKKFFFLFLSLFIVSAYGYADDRQVEMLSYSAIDGSTGMRLCWRTASSEPWQTIGNGYNFVSSDFGPWGSHKKMYAPSLTLMPDNTFTAFWLTEPNGPVVVTATSPDLCQWSAQSYQINDALSTQASIYSVDGNAVSGSVIKVPMSLVDELISYTKNREARAALHDEQAKDDATRFADLGTINYTIKADAKNKKAISDKLIGIFFEDINYSADGGLYAELIQNRDFEYTPSDRKGDRKWNALTAWSAVNNNGKHEIRTDNPIHANNRHYVRLTASKGDYGIENSGYDGIVVKANDKYNLSLWARSPKSAALTISIVTPDNKTIASTTVDVASASWSTYEAQLTPVADCNNARLVVKIAEKAEVDIDMVSLFPDDTFMHRRNGLRKDLAQTLADLKPKFVRFPGGCVAHGDGIDNIYDWKGSIGPLEARKPLRNIWGYHQTRGLGYYEYFTFCEDIGAEPLPVLAAGVPCQNSGSSAHHSHDALTTYGQQCGIPMDEMQAYINDILDLIEYANGDVSTQWGAKRAEAGHPEPFNLKYIGIGNEDMITEVFVPRFKMIYEAVTKAYPDIKVVGTVGPFYEGTDYVEGWKLADQLSIPLVDEHYYVSPGWMIYNQDYYDDYRRGATKVYLGEYAAHLPGRPSNIETALAEALYLTSVERNADVVEMTSYAPLLAKDGHTQWTPDLIYFSNTEVRPTVDYYTQYLFGNNSGNTYIPAATTIDTDNAKAQARVGSSIVKDAATGDIIVKLVNLLPVEVNTMIDLRSLKLSNKSKATCTTLAGKPDDRKATPTSQPIAYAPQMQQTLQPYSLTIIRIAR